MIRTIHFSSFLLALFILGLVLGCEAKKNTSPDVINIMVSILPQKGIVQAIGGPHVHVSVMIPPGTSPSYYNPSPSKMDKLSHATVYIKMGYLPFELANMQRLKQFNPKLFIVNQATRLSLIKGTHGTDPHIWLSPRLMLQQINTIRDALIQSDPHHHAIYKKNADLLSEQIQDLDAYIQAQLYPYKGKHFLVYHPFLGYFAQQYDLIQLAIEGHGKEPTLHHLSEMYEKSQKYRINTLFVQKQNGHQLSQKMSQHFGSKLATLNPLAEDYILMMKQITNTLVKSFESD
ncbi:MAG: zinc ABC transporter substrate-binding protein [Candidatus Margulisbacteria bacterium]|nr:zinc ABC transporter substrate-binding protein [Candidatus Margulisiibacteriota bacterium]